MRRFILPLALVAGFSGDAAAQEKLADRVEDARLEDTVTDLLPALVPENASADPNSDYRQALDATSEFLLKNKPGPLYDQCITALLQNMYGTQRDRIWDILDREGITDYKNQMHTLEIMSRNALGNAGRAATLSDNLGAINAWKSYTQVLRDNAAQMAMAALLIQPRSGEYSV